MFEEEKAEYLRKKTKRIKRTGMIYYLLSPVGLAVFLVGLTHWASDLISAGVAVFVVSLVMGLYSTKRKNDLMKQLRKMGYKEKE